MRPVHLLKIAIALAFIFAAAAVFGQPVAAPAASPALAAAAPPAAAPAPPAPPAAAPATDAAALLPNGRQPLPGVLTGGQPSTDHLEAIAAAGYKVLVNLRPDGEPAPPVAEKAAAVGLKYVHLPIAGAPDLTADNVAALGKLLADRATSPVVVYCATGNRAGALLALEQARVEGKKASEALAIGKAAGLGRLEPSVRELLGLPPW